jgi:hypothetical protein
MNLPTMFDFSFTLYFLDWEDPDFEMEMSFNTCAPTYEAAVAQALSVAQQISRENDKERTLFLRVAVG